MNLKLTTARALFCLTVCLAIIPWTVATAQPCDDDQDCYVSDSVYYLPFSYRPLSCSDSVEARLPVYLWSDAYSMSYGCRFALLGGARFDTGYVQLIGPCDPTSMGAWVTSARDSCSIGVSCWPGELTPASGKIFELVLRCSKADSVKLRVVHSPYGFNMGYPISWWTPLYTRLDTSFIVPSHFTILPGDVNSSGQVSISDAVFLISYVFAGGCAPYDLNAADVNGNCAVSISDAVYLINYIFAGGNAPVPGCTSP